MVMLAVAAGAEPGKGLTATEVAEAKQRLGMHGYWLEPLATERHASWRHAVMAFQKVAGRKRTGYLTREDLDALRHAETLRGIEAGAAHIEIDLHRQVLFFIDADGAAIRIAPISSGSGKCFTEGGWTRRAVTPHGRFTVIRKIAGWRKSPLGELYDPLYFINGTAIHGNPAIPAYPASHGCVRIPMTVARELFRLAPLGLTVLIYDSNPQPSPGSRPCE